MLHTAQRPSDSVDRLPARNDRLNLTPKQGLVYSWGFQPEARFRYLVAGRRFGKNRCGWSFC